MKLGRLVAICIIVCIAVVGIIHYAYYEYTSSRVDNQPVIFADEVANITEYNTIGLPIVLVGEFDKANTLCFVKYAYRFPQKESIGLTYELSYFCGEPSGFCVSYWLVQNNTIIFPIKITTLEYAIPNFHCAKISDQGIIFEKIPYGKTSGYGTAIVLGILFGLLLGFEVNEWNSLRGQSKK